MPQRAHQTAALGAAFLTFLAFSLACLPPPTTYGLRSSGDVVDRGEARLGGGVGLWVPGDAELQYLVDLEVGLTDNLGVGLVVNQGVPTGMVVAEAELLFDADLDAPLELGFRAGIGTELTTIYSDGWYTRPFAGGVVGYDLGKGFKPYAGYTVNPTFEDITWHQVHTGLVVEPEDKALRWGLEVTFMEATAPLVEDIGLRVAPMLFIGGTFGRAPPRPPRPVRDKPIRERPVREPIAAEVRAERRDRTARIVQWTGVTLIPTGLALVAVGAATGADFTPGLAEPPRTANRLVGAGAGLLAVGIPTLTIGSAASKRRRTARALRSSPNHP